ncbi:M23 family metallopeptidase [Paenibacillus donghaensis]|nr:M23 family metallopeptidase [Paenibacillus donghaensis]
MEQKLDIKRRREQRIRSLLEEMPEATPPGGSPLFAKPVKASGYEEWNARLGTEPPGMNEPDPERIWKQRKRDWEGPEDGGRPRFTAGFIRRTVASLVVFSAVWGIFNVQQPWSQRVQVFVTGALSEDMDFAAARVWYEEHFDGAPAFIPIFGDKEVPAEKAQAPHELSAPVAGELLSSYDPVLQGVQIRPVSDSGGGVTVKSIDMGRVLSVTKQQEGLRIVVRHTGDLTAEYGNLSGTKLESGDWVQSGDTVGWMLETESAESPALFFAVMKDKTYIDPTEVVSFD